MARERTDEPFPDGDLGEDFTSGESEGSWRGMLGQLLFENGIIDSEQWAEAERESRVTGKSLSQVLITRGWCTEKQLTTGIAGRREIELPSRQLPTSTPPPFNWSVLLSTLTSVRRDLASALHNISLTEPTVEVLEELARQIDEALPLVEEEGRASGMSTKDLYPKSPKRP